MDGHEGRFGGAGAAVLAAVTLGLCCGAPLLIVAGGAIVAGVGWTHLGIGAGAGILAVAAVLALYRHRQAMRHNRSATDRHLDSVQKEL